MASAGRRYRWLCAPGHVIGEKVGWCAQCAGRVVDVEKLYQTLNSPSCWCNQYDPIVLIYSQSADRLIRSVSLLGAFKVPFKCLLRCLVDKVWQLAVGCLAMSFMFVKMQIR